MSVQTTVGARPRQRRWLYIAATVAAAAAVGVALAFVVGAETRQDGGSAVSANARTPKPSAIADAHRDPSLMSLTPAELAGGALGTGYALPTVHHGPTIASVLASMSPQTRRYTKRIMSLTFTQLAAGAAGSP